jgi:FkbM family methyltransferase
MLGSIKKVIKKVVFHFIKPDVQYVINSYAQAGEDAIIKFLFQGVGIDKPSYLELGVYKPDFGSNTFLFYQAGARGVCVEADQSLISSIKKVRGEDKVLNVGVGVGDTPSVDFYIFNEPSLNTMDKAEAEFRASMVTYSIEKVVNIQLKNINVIIEENFENYPDLLSVDIEGLDLDVLKSLNLSEYPIPVICVETCTYSENHIKPKDYAIQEYMLSNGYFLYADTYINSIFVNTAWFNSK